MAVEGLLTGSEPRDDALDEARRMGADARPDVHSDQVPPALPRKRERERAACAEPAQSHPIMLWEASDNNVRTSG